jgi:hypothetical protein
MTIDYVTIRLYSCCKCGHKWTNWDSKNKVDGRLPLNCPNCRNIRWNQKYTKEDLVLVERLKAQFMIKRNAETRKVVLQPYLFPNKRYIQKVHYFDFIAYHFFYGILPQPEIFEIKQILKIPREKTEQRHDLMLSIMRDRIENQDKYEREHFLKYSKLRYYPRDKMHDYYVYRYFYGPLIKSNVNLGLRKTIQLKRIKGCKHEEKDIQTLEEYNQPVAADFSRQFQVNYSYDLSLK